MRISDWSSDVCSSDLLRVKDKTRETLRYQQSSGRNQPWMNYFLLARFSAFFTPQSLGSSALPRHPCHLLLVNFDICRFDNLAHSFAINANALRKLFGRSPHRLQADRTRVLSGKMVAVPVNSGGRSK